jgi:hypothetical protein
MTFCMGFFQWKNLRKTAQLPDIADAISPDGDHLESRASGFKLYSLWAIQRGKAALSKYPGWAEKPFLPEGGSKIYRYCRCDFSERISWNLTKLGLISRSWRVLLGSKRTALQVSALAGGRLRKAAWLVTFWPLVWWKFRLIRLGNGELQERCAIASS